MEKREIFIVILVAFLMSLIILFHEKSVDVLYAFAISAIILFVSIACKNIAARRIDIKIEHKIWLFQRWWIGKSSHLKKALPAGALFPAILSIISSGFITCFSFLQFDSIALPGKAVKKYGTRRFSEINEFDLSMIAFYGILATLILSLLAKIFSFPLIGFGLIALSKYSFYFAIWNLLPISDLDGARLFFGSSRLYIFTLILTTIVGLIVFLA